MSSLALLPRPVLFGAYGGLAALILAIPFGELAFRLIRPSPPPDVESHTAPRTSLPAAPAENTKFAIAVTPKVTVYPGGTNTVAVRAARDNFNGPIEVRFDSAPGVSGSDLSLNMDEIRGTSVITALAGTKPGVNKLTATATAVIDGKPFSATATVEVTVLPTPPPLPRLAVSVSPCVQAYQRGTNTFAVRVARGEFDGEVTVSFEKSAAGISAPPIVIGAGVSDAVAELTVEGGVPVGAKMLVATASAKPKGTPIYAEAISTVDVLASPKAPVDVVFVFDCTGSMAKTANGVSEGTQTFGAELVKANLDARFGLVGFQDTTLGQPLKIPRLDGTERMSSSAAGLRGGIRGLKLGGGGGEGESSLDGLAEAADSPLRPTGLRVLVLVTDGGPKKVDGRMKGTEETVKYLKAKKIDQLHIVALPEHKKQFEPLFEGAKGKYFDLKAASDANAFDKLMGDVAKAISAGVPEQPAGKVDAGRAAAEPVLQLIGSGNLPPLPPGTEPDEPKVATPAGAKPADQTSAAAETPADNTKSRKVLAFVSWALVVVFLVCGAMLAGQFTFLPGEKPSVGIALAGYGGGLVAGLLAGAAGYFAFDAVGIPFAGRAFGALAFGVTLGAMVAFVERFFRDKVDDDEEEADEAEDEEEAKRKEQRKANLKDMSRAKPAEPEEEPIELDEVAPVPEAAKPKIAPPKSRDGCPGCGRVIPGTAGERYCMLCDKTF